MSSSRNEGKPPACRLSSLRNFGGVLLGRDIAGIFKEGHVYNVMDTIILEDLGPHAFDPLYTGATINQHATSGIYALTEKEYEQQLKTTRQ